MGILDVTGEHIMRLGDEALRALVVRLCEAELRRAGLPLSALRAGGLQEAPDGGVDVRVDLAPGTEEARSLDFIRRPATRFQCKASKMTPSEIRKEMMPKGQLRPAIRELVQHKGCYIIVSSKDTVALIESRRTAMSKCLAGVGNASDLLLDFYDSDALARWASQYPGVRAWIREQVGAPTAGWHAHGDWAASGEAHTSYISDDLARLDMGRTDSGERQRVPIAEGLRTLRERLTQERQAMRLVGLSGTGKTRLVQALFEPDAGPDEPLDQALAVYTDLGEDAQGQLAFVTHLGEERGRAIVVLDNCSPRQHAQFAKVCVADGSRLSLVTIEYDVRTDDEAPDDATQVFRLDPGSEELVAELLKRHPKHGRLAGVARQMIAKFSDGNARLALAMARFAPRSGTVADFSEANLFDRLLHQRHAPSDELRRAAQACALVYSFDGVSQGESSELAALADWADMPPALLGRHVRTLHGRGLIQHRGPWRKLLPQVLAFRLAREALDVLPAERLEARLRGAPRLMRSFTRQLGHLDDSEPARTLVQRWLGPLNGMPRDIAACDAQQLSWFQNIAPVDLGGALAAMERIAMPRWSQFGVLRNLCVALAYDEALFPRAAALLARWCADPEHHRDLETFLRLFQVRLSGTCAQVSTRLQAVQALLDDRGIGHQFGLAALGAMLRAGNLSGHPRYSFGARVRDFGLWPIDEQFDNWYATTLYWTAERADGPLRASLRERVATALPQLCKHIGRPRIAQALTSCVTALAIGSVWPEAWVAVSKVLRRMEIDAGNGSADIDSGAIEPEARGRLEHLEALLRPTGLADQVRVYAMTAPWDINRAAAQHRSENAVSAKATELDEQTTELGRVLAERHEELAILLPELIANNRSGRQKALGLGLSRGCTSGSQRMELWNRMVAVFTATAPNRRNTDILCGFMHGIAKQDAALAQHLLDAVATHPALGRYLPVLEKAAESIGSAGAQRLIRAAMQGMAPAEAFGELQSGEAIKTIPAADLVVLLGVLAEQDNGICVAADLLYMRMLADKQHDNRDTLLPAFGRQILERVCIACQQQAREHETAELVKACLAAGEQPDPALHSFAQRIALAMRDQFTQRRGNEHTSQIIEALLHVQPTATLDVLFGFGKDSQTADYWEFFVADNAPPSWLDKVPDSVLLDWASADPTVRAPRIAAACRYLQEDPDAEPTWTPLARRLIHLCPGRVSVIDQFVGRFVPTGWSGSRAAIVERRRALLIEFFNDPEPAVSTWARERDAKLRDEIDVLREQEKRWELQRQRFEE